MAYIIEGTNYPVVYIANYRVASTSTAGTLMNMGARQVNHHHGLPDEEIPGALVVQTVRHHCDALVSYWFNQGRRYQFNELVDRVLSGRDEYFRAEGFYNRYPCNYILRYETLQLEFDTLCLNAGLPVTKLLTKSSPRPSDVKWQDVILRGEAERIYEHYQEEMDLYGYSPVDHLPVRN